jgi:hypothetical protein
MLLMLLIFLLVPTQNESPYSLGWVNTETGQIITYDLQSDVQTEYDLGKPISHNYRIVDGRYFVTTEDEANAVIVLDLHTGAQCTAAYNLEITPTLLLKDAAIHELNPADCSLTQRATLPENVLYSAANSVELGQWLVLRLTLEHSANLYLLNRQTNDFRQVNEASLSAYSMISFSDDGSYLLYSDNEESYLHHIESETTEILDTTGLYFMGEYIFSSSQNALTVWEFNDGEIGELLVSDNSVLYDHRERFSPNIRYVFYRNAETTYTHIIDLANPENEWVIELPNQHTAQWLPNEEAVLISHEDANGEVSLYRYDLQTSTLSEVLPPINGSVSWLGNEDTTVIYQTDNISGEATYYRYNLDDDQVEVIYSRPNDEVISVHEWSPDHATLLIDVRQDDNGVPRQCPILLEIATGNATNLPYLEGWMNSFWFTSSDAESPPRAS